MNLVRNQKRWVAQENNNIVLLFLLWFGTLEKVQHGGGRIRVDGVFAIVGTQMLLRIDSAFKGNGQTARAQNVLVEIPFSQIDEFGLGPRIRKRLVARVFNDNVHPIHLFGIGIFQNIPPVNGGGDDSCHCFASFQAKIGNGIKEIDKGLGVMSMCAVSDKGFHGIVGLVNVQVWILARRNVVNVANYHPAFVLKNIPGTGKCVVLKAVRPIR